MKTLRTKPTRKLLGAAFVTLMASLCIHAADITLSITSAVHVSWPTTTNRAYQTQTATNVEGPYSATGQLMEGTGERAGTFFTTTNGHRFFRVFETPSSGLSWLEGVWEGQTYQSGAGASSYTTRFSISNSNRVFTGTYPTLPCTTRLELVSYSDAQARFVERVQTGSCIDSAVILTRVTDTNIICNAYLENDLTGSHVFGFLRKIQ